MSHRNARLTPRASGDTRLDGAGGTDMRAAVKAAMQGDPKPKVIVLLTDGFTPWPDSAPDVPVIIGLLGNEPATEVPSWSTSVRIYSRD